eukprot:5470850-Pleurochrysis_carterae.AAC.2
MVTHRHLLRPGPSCMNAQLDLNCNCGTSELVHQCTDRPRCKRKPSRAQVRTVKPVPSPDGDERTLPGSSIEDSMTQRLLEYE